MCARRRRRGPIALVRNAVGYRPDEPSPAFDGRFVLLEAIAPTLVPRLFGGEARTVSGSARAAEHDAHRVRAAVVHERDRRAVHGHAVERG